MSIGKYGILGFDEQLNLSLLRMLWVADATLIFIYLCLGILVVTGTLASIPDVLSLSTDWSIPETFNYLKWVVVILILLTSFAGSRKLWRFFLAISFTVVLADDSLQIHESYAYLVDSLLPGASYALSQAIVFGVLGVVVLGFLGASWVCAGPDDRGKVASVIILIMIIAVFAVGVDFVHDIIPYSLVAYSLGVVLEDGAELFLTSLILSYVSKSIW